MSSTTDLPVQDISSEVLIEKYAKGGEQTPDELRERVARALAQAEKPADRARWTAAFLVGADGKLERVWYKISPKDTPVKLLEALEADA